MINKKNSLNPDFNTAGILDKLNDKNNYMQDSNQVIQKPAIIKNQWAIWPIFGGNGRVLVKEDPFKSRFDCSECSGVGHTGVQCKWCKGTGYDKAKEENGPCRDCDNKAEGALQKSFGYDICPTCKGQGGSIVIPDDNKKNTTTGNVLAISNREILEVAIGDKVMFTSFSGSPFQFLGEDLRIIIEKDLLGKVKQLRQNAEGIREGTFSELENLGVPR